MTVGLFFCENFGVNIKKFRRVIDEIVNVNGGLSIKLYIKFTKSILM